jgi:hypothetical protein
MIIDVTLSLVYTELAEVSKGDYVLSCITTIKLLLRRTLVLLEFHSTFLLHSLKLPKKIVFVIFYFRFNRRKFFNIRSEFIGIIYSSYRC